MKKNTFKTLFLSFLAVSALFVLAACSSPKKAYFQLIDQNTKQDSRITVEYKGDELLINETNNTFYYKPVGLTKDTAKEQTEAYAKSIEGIKGLTHKIEYKDDYLTEKLTIDFSKADIEELQSKQLLQTSGNQKADYISYKETAKLLEKAGYGDLIAHKEQHVNFVAKVAETCQKYETGKLFMSIDICNFLQNWLIHHIQGTDQKYSTLLVEKGIK